MTTVTVPVNLGGDGAPFSDAGEAARDMLGQGYAANFFPLLNQLLAAGNATLTAAASALTAPGTMTTSTTSLTFGAGDRSLTIQTGKAYSPGQRAVIASTASPTAQMSGPIKSYNSGTGALVVTVDDVSGSGTLASWSVALQGKSGNAGIAGRSAIAGATTLDGSHKGVLVDISSGTFSLGFSAVATLGNGWSCFIRNAGTGDVTLDPNAAETIDGLTSFVLYPGAVRLVTCDGVELRSIPLVGGTKIFTSTASYVWPPGISQFDTDVIAAGGGGGGGARAASRFDGGGGGAGERLRLRIFASQITAGGATTCTVGAKGVGGAAAATDSAPGGPGTAGGDSSVGALVVAHAGIVSGLSTGATTSAAGYGQAGGGGFAVGATNLSGITGQARGSESSPISHTQPLRTEWGGPSGREGADLTSTRVSASLGRQTGGRGGGSYTAGVSGANGTSPGDAGDGGAGNVNGSAAGKGGDGADGRITIVEIV